ncbi:MAG: outer membrane beta-barrel protein [Ferruginibacter sp.]
MKLLITTLLSISCFCCVNAQTKLAIKGGFNYSTARAYFNDVKQSTGFVPGGNLAVQLKTAFDGPLHFSPYIAYSTRGFIIKSGNSTGDKTRNFIHYVDVAPVLSLDFATGTDKSLVIGFGPIASLAVGGKEKTTISGVTSSAKMHFSTSKDYGLFDLGLHSSVGWHLKKLFVEAAYQYGFASINNNEDHDKRNIRNRTFSLNIGYYIRSYK